jgi:excisionase family DNA binding protein
MNDKLDQNSDTTMSEPLQLLTAEEAASYLRVSRNTLWRMERRKLIVPYRTLGGHRRYTIAILNEYLERTRRDTTEMSSST